MTPETAKRARQYKQNLDESPNVCPRCKDQCFTITTQKNHIVRGIACKTCE